jgi:hypothetical protein
MPETMDSTKLSIYDCVCGMCVCVCVCVCVCGECVCSENLIQGLMHAGQAL